MDFWEPSIALLSCATYVSRPRVLPRLCAHPTGPRRGVGGTGHSGSQTLAPEIGWHLSTPLSRYCWRREDEGWMKRRMVVGAGMLLLIVHCIQDYCWCCCCGVRTWSRTGRARVSGTECAPLMTTADAGATSAPLTLTLHSLRNCRQQQTDLLGQRPRWS